MNYDKFLERYSSARELSIAKKICEQADIEFGDGGIVDPKRAINLFVRCDAASNSTFYKIKSQVVDLCQWLSEEGVISPLVVEYVKSLSLQDVAINEQTIKENYFADIDEVLDYIQLVGSQHDVGGEHDLLHIKALAILSWMGIPHQDIVSIQKEEACPSTQYSVQQRARFGVSLTPRCIHILHEAANASTYRTFGGKTVSYGDSNCLIRTKGKSKLAVGNLNRLLNHVNDLGSGQFNKYLSINNLQKNAILYQMMQIYGKPSRHDVIELTGCNEAQATWWKTLFDAWFSIYHSTEVFA